MMQSATAVPKGAFDDAWAQLAGLALSLIGHLSPVKRPRPPLMLALLTAFLGLLHALFAAGPWPLYALLGLLASSAAILLASSRTARHPEARVVAFASQPQTPIAVFPPPVAEADWRLQLERQSQRLVEIADRSLRDKVEAERACFERTQELYQFGHELRTPLNAVIGFSELMRSEVFGPLGHPKYRDYVDHVRNSGERLLVVADALILATGGEPAGSAPNVLAKPKPATKSRAKPARNTRRKKARKVTALRRERVSQQTVMEFAAPL